MGDGRRRKASATRNDGRTAPRLSLRVAPTVEATGQDSRSAKSSVNSSQADLSVVVRDFDVRVPNELATRSQPGDEPAAVLGEPATAVPRAGELAASGYAGPPAGQDRSEPDPGEPARADRTTHPQQEILSLPDFAPLSHRYRWDREAEAGLAVDRAVSGAAGTRLQYHVYVLEAKLAFANGMTIPLLSEFLNYENGDQERNKQDYELKAFYRLAASLK